MSAAAAGLLPVAFTDPANWKESLTFPTNAPGDPAAAGPSYYAYNDAFKQTVGGREMTVVSVTNACNDWVDVWGVHPGGAYSGAFERDIFLDVCGERTYKFISAGLLADNDNNQNASVTGNQLTQLSGTSNVKAAYLFGAGVDKSGKKDPCQTLTGSAGVVVKGFAKVMGSIVGGWASGFYQAPVVTGDTAVRIESVQDTDGIWNYDKLEQNFIIGGSAWVDAPYSGSLIRGCSSVTVAIPPEGAPEPVNFIKTIIGGSRSATPGNGGGDNHIVEGSASVTISAPLTVTFTKPVYAGGRNPGGGGTSQVKGTATLTLNGGTFACALDAGLADGEKKIVCNGTNVFAAGASLSGFGLAEAGEGAELRVADGGSLSFDAGIGACLPPFTQLVGTVTVLGCAMSAADVETNKTVAVARVGAGIGGDAVADRFAGVVSVDGTPAQAVFTLDGDTVRMGVSADSGPVGVAHAPAAGETAFTWDGTAGRFDGGKTFHDGYDVTFGDAAEGSRVAVSVPAAVAAGGLSIGSGLDFTGARITAAAAVKRGGGETTVGNDLFAGEVAAAEGTLEAGNVAAGSVAVSNGAVFRAGLLAPGLMKCLRLTVSQTQAENESVAVAELRLYRAAPGGYEAIEWPAGTRLSTLNGSYWCVYKGGAAVGAPVFEGSDNTVGNQAVLSPLIDGIYGDCGFANPYSEDNRYNRSGPWLNEPLTIELPEAIAMPAGYNICLADHGPRHPKAWKIEVSPDGVEWAAAHSQSNAVFSREARAKNPDSNKWLKTEDGEVKSGGPADAPAFLFAGPAAAAAAAVSVATNGTIIADGDWTAGLTLSAGAVVKAVTNGILTLRQADSPVSIAGGRTVTVDLTAFASTAAGRNYIVAGHAADWPDVDQLNVTGGTDKKKLMKDDDKGYYVMIPPRELHWAPGENDHEKTWQTGYTEMPWKDNAAERTYFLDNDTVTFKTIEGVALSEVRVSGTVRPAAAEFKAGQTAYLLLPAEGADAEIALSGEAPLSVKGLVTNRVAKILPGLAVQNGGRFVLDAQGAFDGAVDIASGAAFVLAPAAGRQTLSRMISGAGDIVKEGAGETEITGEIAAAGTLSVAGGTLTIDARNRSVTAAVVSGEDARLRFKGAGADRLKDKAQVFCDRGTIAFAGTGSFPAAPNAPSFTLTNNALLEVETNNGNQADVIALYDSRILIPNGWQELRIDAGTITAGGACGASYSTNYVGGEDLVNKRDRIRVREKIEVLAGGRFDLGVAVANDGGFRKEGPGTLAVSGGARIETALLFNEGTLELPADAGIFRKPVTFAGGTAIDISARTNAYDWGTNLAVNAGDAVEVDVTGRKLKSGERLLVWDAMPEGEFRLAGGNNYGVIKTGKALEATAAGTLLILR